jgi:hypothetical protein
MDGPAVTLRRLRRLNSTLRLQRSSSHKKKLTNHKLKMKRILISILAAVAVLAATNLFAGETHTSTKFNGPKANKGAVTHAVQSGKNILTLSDDFATPDMPAPHWQVVDSHGHVYLLQRLKIKGDKFNKSITLPEYVHDVAKVQIWCAWAEVNLGEASFETPLQLTRN